jgi:membrane associated rhomboid family serine protease
LFPRARIIVLLPIRFFSFFFELPAVTYLRLWVLIQVFSGVLSLASPADVEGIAWWAHVGGFGAGPLISFYGMEWHGYSEKSFRHSRA